MSSSESSSPPSTRLASLAVAIGEAAGPATGALAASAPPSFGGFRSSAVTTLMLMPTISETPRTLADRLSSASVLSSSAVELAGSEGSGNASRQESTRSADETTASESQRSARCSSGSSGSKRPACVGSAVRKRPFRSMLRKRPRAKASSSLESGETPTDPLTLGSCVGWSTLPTGATPWPRFLPLDAALVAAAAFALLLLLLAVMVPPLAVGGVFGRCVLSMPCT
mmetsp:Transcript_17812/g.37707  ORF Transcript_17812/g.37707 Transcript_17812/m.37707 type:complete len:226 (+) Transcript_17812:2436-3113(+)|eukprot:5022325-Pleurochrysis_carterae.AAC.1